MKSLTVVGTPQNLAASLDEVKLFAPSFVLVFAAPSYTRQEGFGALLKHHLGDIPFIGCSTSGEICSEKILEKTVVFVACRMAKTPVRVTDVMVPVASASFDAGVVLGQSLQDPELKAVFILTPGLNVNGSAFVKGVQHGAGEHVIITGGMAGDDDKFQQTFTIFNGNITADRAVGIGFYGDAVHVGYGSDGGWRSFGPARRVTKSQGQILYELDGKPALQLYKEYLGDKASELPASGLSYPFAILNNNREISGLIRSALDIDHEQGALILAGDMPQDSWVCLMHADSDALTEGARVAAEKALKANPKHESGGVVFAVSCIGRRLVMALDAEDDTEALRAVFGDDVAIGGFFSYGEICPMQEGKMSELHNQTMTLTYLTESDVT